MTSSITFKTIEELIEELDKVKKVYEEEFFNIMQYKIDWTTNTIIYPSGDPLDCPYARGRLRDMGYLDNCQHKDMQQEFRGNDYNPKVCQDCGYEYSGMWWEKY